MTSFLVKNKSKESYEQRISTEPITTQRCKLYAIKNFDHFVSEAYDDRTANDIIEEERREMERKEERQRKARAAFELNKKMRAAGIGY